jgi:hypothetical protein
MNRSTTAVCVTAAFFALAICAGCQTATPGGDASPTESATVSAAPTVAPTGPAPLPDPNVEIVPGGPYAIAIDPANFVAGVNNPYFPLVPDSSWSYEETDTEGDTIYLTAIVTTETKVIMGVTCMFIHVIETATGGIQEETWDYYAQDRDGNVWYFGEETRAYTGHSATEYRTEGSWEAGVDGALPGLIMLAKPATGPAYRQEYYVGHAEDCGQVIETGATIEVRGKTYTDCVVTNDWSLLSKAGKEKKWYAPGVGCVYEEAGDSKVELLIQEKP